MNELSKRITQLDVMRGVAVVAMVLGHSIDAVLSPDVRAIEAFRLYDFARGFTAPVFLVLSGFAFAVSTERRWAEYIRPSVVVGKRLLKIALLVAIGYALHLPFFSLGKIMLNTTPDEYARFCQVDVLQCVAGGVLLLQLLTFLSRTPRRFALMAFLAGSLITFVTPLVWTTDFGAFLPRWLIPYLNQQQPSMFPLFPYAAYMLFGATTGHLYLRARSSGQEQIVLKAFLAAGAALFAVGLLIDQVPLQLYPSHDYWKASPSIILIRTGVVLLVTSAFFSMKRIHPIIADSAGLLGRSSFLVYAAHIPLVYGSSINAGLAQLIGRGAPVHATMALALGVLVSMLALAHLVAFLRRNHRLPFRFAQAGLACSLLYVFLTKPF